MRDGISLTPGLPFKAKRSVPDFAEVVGSGAGKGTVVGTVTRGVAHATNARQIVTSGMKLILRMSPPNEDSPPLLLILPIATTPQRIFDLLVFSADTALSAVR